jgi:signal transduction histidine kinase/CheY-like chemotaxis protein
VTSPRRSLREFRGTDLLVALGVAVLYVAAAKLGLTLAFQAAQVSAVWPPTGLALAALLRLGPRAAPGVLLGAFVANATAGEPLWVAAGIAVGNTFEAVVGATLLSHLGFDGRLARLRDALALIAAAVVSPAVAATIGVTCLGAGGVQPASSLQGLWRVWWLGDALGDLIVAPFLLVWTARQSWPRRRGAVIEAFALLAGLFAASAIAFGRVPPSPALEYVTFPVAIWAALRLGPPATATVTAGTYAFAVWATHRGLGPFAGAGPEGGLVPLQVFMAVFAMTALFLGAIASQHRQAEEELRRHAEQLSEVDRRKDEFLAMLSHELRNPLAPILHAVELLGHDDPRLASKAREIIGRQSEHLTRLVDDLLDVSRITRGTVRLSRRRVALKDVVDAAVDTWRHLIAQRRQELSVEIPEVQLFVEADPTRLAQVIANLLHNAAKFTPEGGRIAITAAREEGGIALAVRDEGSGIAPEHLDRVFELFVQGPPSLDRPQGGLGLGLTLARRLAELHGGTLEAASEGAGRGSEFVVRIPEAPAAEPAAPKDATVPASRAPVGTGRGRRVLVVDDNADARDAMQFLLEDDGHEVRSAGDGPGALEEARSFQPQVVLLDIGLPGMDGYEVSRALRAVAGCERALIVAVSGYGQAEDRARSRVAGFDEHLLKPVAPDRLLEIVRRPVGAPS